MPNAGLLFFVNKFDQDFSDVINLGCLQCSRRMEKCNSRVYGEVCPQGAGELCNNKEVSLRIEGLESSYHRIIWVQCILYVFYCIPTMLRNIKKTGKIT